MTTLGWGTTPLCLKRCSEYSLCFASYRERVSLPERPVVL